jgi:hypothetical protein
MNVLADPAYAETLLQLTQLRWRMRHEDQRAELWAQGLR